MLLRSSFLIIIIYLPNRNIKKHNFQCPFILLIELYEPYNRYRVTVPKRVLFSMSWLDVIRLLTRNLEPIIGNFPMR